MNEIKRLDEERELTSNVFLDELKSLHGKELSVESFRICINLNTPEGFFLATRILLFGQQQQQVEDLGLKLHLTKQTNALLPNENISREEYVRREFAARVTDTVKTISTQDFGSNWAAIIHSHNEKTGSNIHI